ncbi:MAG TPA: response regulator [Longimicrobium sp.]|nr:response regulator [Longimicrobium sp.]
MAQKLILVCDDVEDNRIVFKAVLEHGGFAVLVARDGTEAVEQARAFTPSLIVMDLMMPGVDGWQAVAQLKADPATREIPVIAVTADMHASRDALQRAGFCAYVTKPLLPKQFLAAVNECLGQLSATQAPGWITLPLYGTGGW